ncbi:hypothetical protein RhiirA5_502805 [Rhizophagus irregularis]|uniref:Uncharacterized protein n=1 Tax=Rhizophagus irregularis TaxID=588596 RepID=A0A2N0R2S0_9GLOM|nr:hypothetical protein RhiirA5_502805 [Rhizophagus irregularis]PKC57589.1 hypothetical protein RhiirA1_541539 [Rhizophagus irregularis]CAB4495386.1 unnamed protein product [Rhizophagus irregularis]CAB5198146.1 unnamed protein product [Rhizophagus irregularis]CAB5321343.1 unnamed protein product [Rhizophagus irregularis]
MRLLVAEKLYPLFPTTEYRDIPLSEINKCIDKDQLLILVINSKISKSRKPNGNSKRFKKRKLIESNNEINEEGQQASGPTLSSKNCAVDRVIQQKIEEERETDQEVSQVKDYDTKHKATHNNSIMKNEKKLLK